MRAHMCVAYEATFPLPDALMFALTPLPTSSFTPMLTHIQAERHPGLTHIHTYICTEHKLHVCQ